MAQGGGYIAIQGLDEFQTGMLGMARGLVPARSGCMQDAFQEIADIAARDVKRHAPVGSASPKDGRGHLPPGSLRDSIHGKATQWAARVETKWKGPLMLQEFGGKSIWKRGSGATFHRTRARNRSTGVFTTNYKSAQMRKHFIYEKPRAARGYFIWNVGWRLRMVVPAALQEAIVKVGTQNGIAVEVAQRGTLTGFDRASSYGMGVR